MSSSFLIWDLPDIKEDNTNSLSYVYSFSLQGLWNKAAMKNSSVIPESIKYTGSILNEIHPSEIKYVK